MSSLLRFKAATSVLWLSALAPFMASAVNDTGATGITGKKSPEVFKDPTMPLLNSFGGGQGMGQGKKAEEQEVPLVLQGLVLKSGKRYAVINGQVLTEGKTIEGYEVILITPDTVQLQGADEAFTLTLQKVTIKHSNE